MSPGWIANPTLQPVHRPIDKWDSMLESPSSTDYGFLPARIHFLQSIEIFGHSDVKRGSEASILWDGDSGISGSEDIRVVSFLDDVGSG